MSKDRKKSLPPNGCYLTVKKWIRKTYGKGNVPKYYKVLDRKRNINLSPPDCLPDQVHPVFSSHRLHTWKGTVTIIPNGRVWGKSAAVITSDNKLLWELCQEKGKPAKHDIFRKRSLPNMKSTSKTIAVIAVKNSGNYYHWLFDLIPRIALIKKSGIPVDQYLIYGKKRSPFQEETLKALGIRRKHLISTSKKLHLQAKKLIVPHFTGGHRPEWVGKFLKDKLFSKMNIKPLKTRQRIYISRKSASQRRVVNENEVMKLLNKHGFKRVQLENLSVSQQMELFASAEIVVAPHGAGLANLIFCPLGAKVIELFPPNKVKRCYWVVSQLAKAEYHYLIGKGKFSNYDIKVDLAHLSRMLSKCGI